jgi:hypothetical protein
MDFQTLFKKCTNALKIECTNLVPKKPKTLMLMLLLLLQLKIVACLKKHTHKTIELGVVVARKKY